MKYLIILGLLIGCNNRYPVYDIDLGYYKNKDGSRATCPESYFYTKDEKVGRYNPYDPCKDKNVKDLDYCPCEKL